MKLAYVDTSCLVAVALGESDWQQVSERLSSFNRLVASNLLEAELRAALSRERVDRDPAGLLSWIGWVYPHRPLTLEYRDVLEHGHVRGADLWHLASALFVKRRLGEVAFLTLDERQRKVAQALDFAV